MAAVYPLRRGGAGERTVTLFPAHIHSTKVKIAIAEAIWYNIRVKKRPIAFFSLRMYLPRGGCRHPVIASENIANFKALIRKALKYESLLALPLPGAACLEE